MQYRLGMVLSGGGVRCLAQAGVLRALREEQIAVDCIAATSAGAIVGAFHGAGYQAGEILQFFETESPFRLSKLSLLKPGIIDTRKVLASFQRYLPEDSFEALRIRLFVCATDLVAARLEIFSSGPLIAPILASCSVPLLFTPTEIDGGWFADGGIIDNFPVEPLIGHCDSILGVYVNPLRRVEIGDLDSSLSVVQRSLEVGRHYSSTRKFHQCDLVLFPEGLSEYGWLDTRRLAEIEEVGYQAARARMEEIRKLVQVA